MKLLSCSLSLWAFAVFVQADDEQVVVLGRESFEQEKAIAGNYVDTVATGLSDYNPGNLAEQPIIDATTSSGLPFDLSYQATRQSIPDPGFSNGAEIGVKSNAMIGDDSFTDGTQGYKFANPDGTMILTFAAVDVSSHGDVTVSVDYLIGGDTEWERTDKLSIVCQVTSTNDAINTNTVVTIIDTAGQDIDSLGIKGNWITGIARIPDAAALVQLVVSFESGSPPEFMLIDNVIIRANNGEAGGDFGDSGGGGDECNDVCSGFFFFFCWSWCLFTRFWYSVFQVVTNSSIAGISSGISGVWPF